MVYVARHYFEHYLSFDYITLPTLLIVLVVSAAQNCFGVSRAYLVSFASLKKC